MIQFNLLPDIKQEYMKVQRTRRLITAISVLAALVSLGLVVVTFIGTDVVQKKRLHDLNNSIKQNSKSLQKISNLNKILTIQNQLNSLTGLHNKKPAATKLFSYLDQTTPNQAYINNLTADFTQDTLSITGTADTLKTVNQYVDTLKNATYTTGNDPSGKKNAFSSVVLSSFGRSSGNAQYTITLNYDPAIFDITQTVKLDVPDINVTRSGVASPNALFETGPNNYYNSGNGANAGGQ
jgi:Tfp pilus assembly protein PilN